MDRTRAGEGAPREEGPAAGLLLFTASILSTTGGETSASGLASIFSRSGRSAPAAVPPPPPGDGVELRGQRASVLSLLVGEEAARSRRGKIRTKPWLPPLIEDRWIRRWRGRRAARCSARCPSRTAAPLRPLPPPKLLSCRSPQAEVARARSSAPSAPLRRPLLHAADWEKLWGAPRRCRRRRFGTAQARPWSRCAPPCLVTTPCSTSPSQGGGPSQGEEGRSVAPLPVLLAFLAGGGGAGRLAGGGWRPGSIAGERRTGAGK
jgi:hypothetical protein